MNRPDSARREFQLPLGRSFLPIVLPQAATAPGGMPGLVGIQVVDAQPQPALPDFAAALTRALAATLAGASAAAREHLGAKGAAAARDGVAIVVSDATRPLPVAAVLDVLIPFLEQRGVSRRQVVLFIGGGLHPPVGDAQQRALLGERWRQALPVVAHDARDRSNLAYLGTTQRGTPVWINRRYLDTGLRVAVSVLEPHQFMGFTGGEKAVAIGLAGEDTITANHALMRRAGAQIGRVDGNPARQDVNEIGRMARLDWSIIVVLNPQKQPAAVFAGRPREAHAAAVRWAVRRMQARAAQPADLVVASAGGYPKDLNVYQAQKALAAAARLARPGGEIFLLADCPEGWGDPLFQQTMQSLKSFRTPPEVLADFASRPFTMGRHKAHLWCRSLAQTHVTLVSAHVTEDDARALMVKRVVAPGQANEAIWRALTRLAARGRAFVAIMPHAGSVIPVCRGAVPWIAGS